MLRLHPTIGWLQQGLLIVVNTVAPRPFLAKALNCSLASTEVHALHILQNSHWHKETSRECKYQTVCDMDNYFTFRVGLEEVVAVQDEPAPVGVCSIAGSTSICVHDLITATRFLSKELSVEKQGRDESGKEVHDLQNHEADEKAVVPPADAGVEPWAVVVEPLDAEVADVAVSAAWQDYHLALRTHLGGLELLKQLHKTDVGVFAYVARVNRPGQKSEQAGACEEQIQNELDRLSILTGQVRERNKVHGKPAEQHEDGKHCHGGCRLGLLVHRLLYLQELK